MVSERAPAAWYWDKWGQQQSCRPGHSQLAGTSATSQQGELPVVLFAPCPAVRT
jgi:hypothetical protein